MAVPELHETCFIKEIFKLNEKWHGFTLHKYQFNGNVWEMYGNENQGFPEVCHLYKLHIMDILKT